MPVAARPVASALLGLLCALACPVFAAPLPTSGGAPMAASGSSATPAATEASLASPDAASHAVASPQLRRFAGTMRSLGSPRVVAPGFVATYLIGHIAHAPEMNAATTRVLIATASAVAASEGARLTSGRPLASGDGFETLSPAGSAALAFGLATALTHETDARWVRWVVFPAAAAVSAARLEQEEGGAGEAIAGAVAGAWIAARAEGAMRSHPAFTRDLSLISSARRGAFKLGARIKF